ncbi:MAG: flippase-like domain-containing protein [Pseudomonadota bacterium]|nr:flippase-like domain-containing protein [Pseudomonadota bacterium]
MQGKLIKIFFFCIGLALFLYLLSLNDLDDIANQIFFLGFNGFFIIYVIFILYFGSDSLSWQMTFTNIRFNARWASRFFGIRMVGEAYNNILPAASLGGEPLKALILKNNYQVSFVDSTSALIISKTVSMLSLVGFIGLAFFLSLDNPRLSSGQKNAGALLLSIATFFIFIFFILQKKYLLSRMSDFFCSRFRKHKLIKLFEGIKKVDQNFNRFYINHKKRLALSFFFASLNWFFGVVELYLIFYFLGRPLTWEDAILLEGLIQLVRTMTFFIPSAIGTQEGAFFLGSQILLGAASLGLTASLIRRARDFIWIFLSLILSLSFELKKE